MASGLTTTARSLSNSKARSLQLQRSWRAQPLMRSGRSLSHQTLDALVDRLLERRCRASPSAVEKGGSLFSDEAGRDRIDGGARAREEDAGDLGGRETVRSEQHYVQPQPPARLAFSLHFPYEILAFGGGDGDTLHGRPFHWWLDGFGIFTMPQETVVCSITLCIYLGRARTCASKLVAGAGVSGSNPLVGSPGIGVGKSHSLTSSFL
jgi:hypothetical protein